MEGRQWYALGILFLVFTVLCMYHSITWGNNTLYWRSVTESGGDNIMALEGAIVSVVHDAAYTILAWLFFAASGACFICGLLERRKEIV